MKDLLGVAEAIKNLRECMDWLMQLPEKLISTVSNTQSSWHTVNNRIRTYTEIAELREIGKRIGYLYISKGSIVVFAQSCIDNAWVEEVYQLKMAFREMAAGLDELMTMISESHISRITLCAEAVFYLAHAIDGYKELAQIPDHVLLKNTDILILSLKYMEVLNQNGIDLIKRLDEYRDELDRTYQ